MTKLLHGNYYVIDLLLCIKSTNYTYN